MLAAINPLLAPDPQTNRILIFFIRHILPREALLFDDPIVTVWNSHFNSGFAQVLGKRIVAHCLVQKSILGKRRICYNGAKQVPYEVKSAQADEDA